jgi:3-deoxy-manno-octulosonate cytidylyltransferase (CMP-KDO synthetase)
MCETEAFKHHGIYAYRKDFLDTFTSLPEGKLEKLEALEQLRAIEHGYRIKIVITEHDSVEVDTPDELARVRDIIMEKGEERNL